MLRRKAESGIENARGNTAIGLTRRQRRFRSFAWARPSLQCCDQHSVGRSFRRFVSRILIRSPPATKCAEVHHPFAVFVLVLAKGWTPHFSAADRRNPGSHPGGSLLGRAIRRSTSRVIRRRPTTI